jgi:hypothetical protein
MKEKYGICILPTSDEEQGPTVQVRYLDSIENRALPQLCQGVSTPKTNIRNITNSTGFLRHAILIRSLATMRTRHVSYRLSTDSELFQVFNTVVGKSYCEPWPSPLFHSRRYRDKAR